MSSRTRWFSDPLWYLLFCAAFLSLWCLQMDVDRAVRIRWYQNRAISTLQDSGCFGWALACKMSCTGFERERERERSGLESSGGSAFSLPQRLTDARMWKWTSNHRCPSWKTCCRWFVVVLARLFEKRLHKNTKQIFGSSESVLDAQSRGTSLMLQLDSARWYDYDSLGCPKAALSTAGTWWRKFIGNQWFEKPKGTMKFRSCCDSYRLAEHLYTVKTERDKLLDRHPFWGGIWDCSSSKILYPAPSLLDVRVAKAIWWVMNQGNMLCMWLYMEREGEGERMSERWERRSQLW